MSFAAGRFWAEAEADFRRALRERSRDQLWPRTYGLHFLPEYFPKRELGITVYHQGRLAEAESLLERSVKDVYSARAAYYLNLIRRALAETGQDDAEPPQITLDVVAGVVGEKAVRVSGVARDDRYVRSIRINEVPFPVDVFAREVAFNTLAALEPGQNSIVVEAVDILGHSAVQSFIVRSDVDGPVIGFDWDRFPIVTGLVRDESGVRYLSFDSVEVELTPVDADTWSFAAPIQPTSVVAYKSEDLFGNLTEGMINTGTIGRSRVAGRLEHAFAARRPSGVAGAGESHGLARRDEGVQASEPQTGLNIAFNNIHEGDIFYQSEIYVQVWIESERPISVVSINGRSLSILPGGRLQTAGRRIPLDHFGHISIVAEASDDNGAQVTQVVNVERRPSAAEQLAKYDVLYAVSERVPTIEGWEYIESQLGHELAVLDRFHLRSREMEVVDRALFEWALSRALADPKERLFLQETVPAELMFLFRIHHYAYIMELVLEIYGTESLGAGREVPLIARLDVVTPFVGDD